MRARSLIVPSFSPQARELRAHFDARLANPRSTDGGRFVWDYWHVPGQYTLLRTPAWHYFPAPLYRALHERLVRWGRENLGCHDISPPWMSCYVEGCRQELHGDLPHGPFAFVFSLTRWERRRFRGGETLLLRDEALDLWRNLDRFRGMEEPDLLTEIPARFNQLLVFDPRIPHGVRRVEGCVHDPREGRLVIHGWFVQPRPYVEGPLPRAALARAIERLIGPDAAPLPAAAARAADSLRGVLVLRFGVDASGRVRAPRVLRSTLIAVDGDQRAPGRYVSALARRLAELRFARARGPSRVTLPIVFERS